MIEHLLQQVAHINQKHAALAQETKHAFNIFSILRQADDEVHLHSRFIAELLDPQGAHGMRSAFLAAFLEQLGSDIIFDVMAVTVQREYQHIDIFIANDVQQAIILENKIYAPDQPKQLQRYYKAIRKQGYQDVFIVYLSLYGDPPGKESAGNLDEDVITISYADDVRAWLDACIVAAEAYPVVRETLVQYQRLIEDLTGQAGGGKLMDVKALLQDAAALRAAISISQALTEVKIDTHFKFWFGLEEKIAALQYRILDAQKYSRKKVAAYHKKAHSDYGLVFFLPELVGQEILAFCVGLHLTRIYYGFMAVEDGVLISRDNSPGFELLAEILAALGDEWHTTTKSMVGWRYADRRIEFSNFNTPETLALIDPEKRNAYLDELVDEIIVAIEQFYEACERDPRLAGEAEW